jgi:hypothetical protein
VVFKEIIEKVKEEKNNIRIIGPFIGIFVLLPILGSPLLIMFVESNQNEYFKDYFNAFTYIYEIFFGIDLTEEKASSFYGKIVVGILGIIKFIFLGFVIAGILSLIRLKFLKNETKEGSNVLDNF